MITVNLYNKSGFKFNSKKVKDAVKQALFDEGIVSDSEVSLAIVGRGKMEELVKDYYKEDTKNIYDHPILTFPSSEVQGVFMYPPESKNDIGEMIISYQSCVERAGNENKLVDEVLIELARHGVEHLMGKHHH